MRFKQNEEVKKILKRIADNRWVWLVVECTRELFRKENWWVYPSCIFLGYGITGYFTENYWTMIFGGILTFPFALMVVLGSLNIKNNQKLMTNIIQRYVYRDKSSNGPPLQGPFYKC